jgi:hypothetical protein
MTADEPDCREQPIIKRLGEILCWNSRMFGESPRQDTHKLTEYRASVTTCRFGSYVTVCAELKQPL